jgi:hypothetical protein
MNEFELDQAANQIGSVIIPRSWRRALALMVSASPPAPRRAVQPQAPASPVKDEREIHVLLRRWVRNSQAHHEICVPISKGVNVAVLCCTANGQMNAWA